MSENDLDSLRLRYEAQGNELAASTARILWLELESEELHVKVTETEHLLSTCREQCDELTKCVEQRDEVIRLLRESNVRLRQQRDQEKALAFSATRNWHRITMERDELLTGKEKHSQTVSHESLLTVIQERNEARQWARKFHMKWIRTRAHRDRLLLDVHIAYADIDDLRVQLVDERNKALDEAIETVDAVWRTGYHGINITAADAIKERLYRLKS